MQQVFFAIGHPNIFYNTFFCKYAVALAINPKYKRHDQHRESVENGGKDYMIFVCLRPPK
jgi:hypothetical protein